jgi:hypothetical protein
MFEFGRVFAANSFRMQPSNSPGYRLMQPDASEAKKVLKQLGRIDSGVFKWVSEALAVAVEACSTGYLL